MFSLKLFSILCLCAVNSLAQTPPNIVIIVGDDMGRNDVSFNKNNEFILTPNLDALGFNGIILNNHYAHAMCTPSRGALMTGKYCTHTGLQHNVINNDEPYGLSVNETTLPQYLKTVGYKTHLVGKWHLGASSVKYNPVRRGFDTFFGYLGGFIRYFQHDCWILNQPFWPYGYDMRTNESIDYSFQGVHATELFTNKAIDVINQHDTSSPLFLTVTHLAVHSENVLIPFPFHTTKYDLSYWYILGPMRRNLARETSLLDDSCGNIVEALHKKGILNNTIVIFMSDNGAPSLGLLYTTGNNWPLKGQKNSPWEGATRVPAVIWSPLLKKQGYVSQHMMHITDWLVTLGTLAGVNFAGTKLDGIDMWNTLSNNLPNSPRTEIVHNVDDYISIRRGDFKYVKGTTDFGLYDWWIGEILQRDALVNQNKFTYRDQVRSSQVATILRNYTVNQTELSDSVIESLRDQTYLYCDKPKNLCLPTFQPCLFNIRNDPCEYQNLFNDRRDIVAQFENYLRNNYSQTIVPKRNEPSDPNANPAYYDYTWAYWKD